MARTCVGLLVFAGMAWAQRPSDVDAAALIEKSRQKALEYAKSLPDFECIEVVHRYADYDPKLLFGMVPTDKLTIRIRYAQHREEHKLMLIDDHDTERTFESLAGAIGTGEFGATLRAIFDPATQTGFVWAGSKKESKHRFEVYEYSVDEAHSRYHLWNGGIGSDQGAVVGYHGVLEIDAATGEVLHFSYVADDLPTALLIRSASTTVDYALAMVGGRAYLLPARSVTELRSTEGAARNEIQFREYHKFSADSSIVFGPVK